MRKNELLVPASSLEVLKIAVIYGADAVYIGGEAFGLRAKAKNFTKEEMAEGIAFAHARGVKVYVTANILAHNYDLDGVREYLTELQNMKPDRPDALIIADPAIFTIAGEVCPDIDRHISTQANNTNYGTFQFWEKLGATRVVTARELSLREIRQIREHISDDLEIETFVHGAMCISYSGGDGDRDVYSWGDVYFVLGKMSAVQLFYRKGCQPRGMYTSVPVEIFCG